MMVALIGDRGKGKTQIAVELLKHAFDNVSPTAAELLDRDQFEKILRSITRAGMFIELSDMISDIKKAYDNRGETDTERAKKYKVPKLLIIDEVQEGLRSEWERTMFTNIMNKRYNETLDTVFIANMQYNQLSSHVGSSIYDRIQECGGVMECSWSSFRTGE
jgi:DNA replication protein DnaC